MGMYNDNTSSNRLQWTYIYTGKELLISAKSLYVSFLTLEKNARDKMAKLMSDMTVSQSDPEIEATKRDITKYGTLKEQCEVFTHEFQRNPLQKYNLGLGDVTFFGLAKIE
jgi:hypothetical protein